ncbi:MAG: glutaredoxin 3 [Gammaproteobacteria bacterium]|nr:glutaredoxin 3 [Gammaproteobacteria bacterium]
MAKIEIYSSAHCPYCTRAKELLERKGVAYNELWVDQKPALFQEMQSRCQGRRSVPQIVINDKAIGGFNELWKLEKTGQLDKLLT